MTLALRVADVAVRTDDAGRFCLNDLHRAAGGQPRHRPGYWLANAQTHALIDAIGDTAGNPAVRSVAGRDGGTYVARELVYAYAMWVSPEFNLRVIRAYDEAWRAAAPPAPPAPPALPNFADPVAAARAWADAEERRQAAEQHALALAAKVESDAPKLQALRRIRDADASLTMTETAKVVGVKPRTLIDLLDESKWIYRRRKGGNWLASQGLLDSGLLEHKVHVVAREEDGGEYVANHVRVTAKGLTTIARMVSGEKPKRAPAKRAAAKAES